MKKKLFALLLIITIAVPLSAASKKTKYVTVETVSLKNGTGFFSSEVATLQYGDAVTVIRTKGSKSYVSLKQKPAVKGWLASKSLTKKKIVKSSNVSASADEIALAGKGFSSEVEQEYRKTGRYDYKSVDAIEKKAASDKAVYTFIIEGDLKGAE